MKKPKVIVIFPKYDPKDDTHFPYWYRVFEEAGKELDLVVLFETGDKNCQLKNLKAYVQQWQQKPINLIERFFVLLKCRFQGFSHFYTHYSFYGFLFSKVITFLFGGKTYLWDCEYYDRKPTNLQLIFALKYCDVLVNGHEKIAKQYLKVMSLPRKQYQVVSNWVWNGEEDLQEPSRNPEENQGKNILFIHHLSQRKGSRDLPEIITGVLKRLNNVTFTIVGNGPDYGWLQKWVKENALEGKVLLKGALDHHGIKKSFENADIFIMPSRSEGFPRVILEAMIYGVPYVATDVGCVKEISPEEEQEHIVTRGNLILFVDKIITVLESGDNRASSLKRIEINKVKEYSLQRSSKEFVTLFRNTD